MNLPKQEKSLKNNQQSLTYHEKQGGNVFVSSPADFLPLLIAVECNKQEIIAYLDDGRKVSIPTAWYPRTRQATLKQLKNFRITSDKYGIHWPELDEHLSVKAFLQGLKT